MTHKPAHKDTAHPAGQHQYLTAFDCKRPHPQPECACIACEEARRPIPVYASPERRGDHAGHEDWKARAAQGWPQDELSILPLD